ncbi:MAG: DNA gyrase inhibitor YacG [Planctomycetota bacterium]|nr:MAG: DNA gyrase inhibitor YacG [Planctomycetota bacterium]
MPLCPVCNALINLTTTTTIPFCSARCRLIDLGRWLDEGYSVPETRRSDEGDLEESEEIG